MKKTYRERLNRSFGNTLLDTPVPPRASGTNKIRSCSETENTKIPSPSTSSSAKIKATPALA